MKLRFSPLLLLLSLLAVLRALLLPLLLRKLRCPLLLLRTTPLLCVGTTVVFCEDDDVDAGGGLEIYRFCSNVVAVEFEFGEMMVVDVDEGGSRVDKPAPLEECVDKGVLVLVVVVVVVLVGRRW